MYMVNQIDLSDINMQTLLLMILHDLPHDYKVKRLEAIWEKTKPKKTTTGGYMNWVIGIGGFIAISKVVGAYIFGRSSGDEEQLSDALRNQLDINSLGVEELYKQAVFIVYRMQLDNLKKENPKNKKQIQNLEDEYNIIRDDIGIKKMETREAAIRIKSLDKLVSIVQMQILNTLSPSSKKGGEGPPGLIGISDSSSDDSNQEFPSRSKYPLGEQLVPQEFLTLDNNASNNEFHTPETPSSNNEYLTPHITQQEESLPSTSRPQTNKTNPPTVTTNRTKNKKKKSRKKRNIRTRRTRRRNRRTRKRNKEKLNNANDIRLKNNIAMNEIFKNAFEIVYNDTNNSEIKEIITAFYTFYSMIKITSEISPLDAFNSDYVKSSLLIYMILKRSSFDADLKIIFDTVFSSHNTFKGGGKDEIKSLIKQYTDQYKIYYTGAQEIIKKKPDITTQEIIKKKPDITTLKNNVLKLIKLFKTEEIWNEELLKTYNIKSNTIDRQIATINIQDAILINSVKTGNVRRANYNNNLENTIKTQYLKIMFEHIIIPIEKKTKEQSIVQDENKAIPSLRSIAIENPHRLVSALLKGVFTFSGIESTDNQSLDAGFYNGELVRLNKVGQSDGIYLNGETLDEHLLDHFRKYTDAKVKKGKTSLWSKHDAPPAYKKNPHIINNGCIIGNSFENNAFINKKNVTCTLSQIVDAMGNFGNCSNSNQVSNYDKSPRKADDNFFLSHTTDVILVNNKGDYYASKMEETNDRQIHISYSFKLGNLETPPFFRVIDNSSDNGNVLELSLTNTYKSVITRLLYIWAEDPTLQVSEKTYTLEEITNLYNKITKNEDTFIDLLLTSLQKGSGDNNQEWNSVFKNRGYIDLSDDDEDGFIADLLYIANDRPSAIRAMFTLINGTGDINDNVTAGFPSGRIYITRPPPPPAVAAKKPATTTKSKKNN